jgi:hypothetical protein
MLNSYAFETAFHYEFFVFQALIPDMGRKFFLSPSSDHPGAHATSYPMATRDSFPRSKVAGE